MMALPKKMYAGVVGGRIYVVATDRTCDDPYCPLGIALFKSEAEARRRFETVIAIDPAKLLRAASAK